MSLEVSILLARYSSIIYIGGWVLVTLVLVGLVSAAVYFIREAMVREKSLQSKVVLITGAAQGLGKVLAKELAHKERAVVVLWDINKTALEETVIELRRSGCQAYGYQVDVANEDQVTLFADRVHQEVGQVYCLINNAGIVTKKQRMLDISTQQMMKIMNVNVISHLYTTRAFLKPMLERDEGHIVTVASAAGLSGVAYMADYCCSKFAVYGWAEAMRRELEGYSNIKTTIVCPFYIRDTNMFTMAESKSRFLPILCPKYVTGRIVRAIKRNEAQLVMPFCVNLVFVFRFLCPINIQDRLAHFFGYAQHAHY